MFRSATSAALTLLISLHAASIRAQEAFQFALFGDLPYNKIEEAEFDNIIRQMNARELAFVVHVGDMQTDPRAYNSNPTRASMPCTDEMNDWLLAKFQTIRHPVIMTPGDNDWTDCHFLQARKYDPVERLAAVRKKFYPDGKSLGGRTIAVTSQASDPKFSKFRENLRWSIGGITFATLHIVGSNDNLGRTPEMDEEQRERKAANFAWLSQAFAQAKADKSLGLVLMTQANPSFENSWSMQRKTSQFQRILGVTPPNPPAVTAYEEYVTKLVEEMEGYDKPVAFLHGDTHTLRIDQPLYSPKTNRPFENFMRVETFGSPNSHWILINVDPKNPQIFRFEPQIVPENVIHHKKN